MFLCYIYAFVVFIYIVRRFQSLFAVLYAKNHTILSRRLNEAWKTRIDATYFGAPSGPSFAARQL